MGAQRRLKIVMKGKSDKIRNTEETGDFLHNNWHVDNNIFDFLGIEFVTPLLDNIAYLE